MTIFGSIDEALNAIQAYNGPPEKFELRIDSRLLDALGLNVAIMTDAILSRGWEPDGVEECGRHRLFRYRLGS